MWWGGGDGVMKMALTLSVRLCLGRILVSLNENINIYFMRYYLGTSRSACLWLCGDICLHDVEMGKVAQFFSQPLRGSVVQLMWLLSHKAHHTVLSLIPGSGFICLELA